jgi:hypothetical protein
MDRLVAGGSGASLVDPAALRRLRASAAHRHFTFGWASVPPTKRMASSPPIGIFRFDAIGGWIAEITQKISARG